MLSRRAFVAACAAVPLLPSPSKSHGDTNFKFGLRCGLIWCRGRQLKSGKWHLAAGLYEKRWRSDGEVRFRHLTPSPKFLHRLRQRGFQFVRSKRQPVLVDKSATLPHGPISIAFTLERIAPISDQSELYFDLQPSDWGDFTIFAPSEYIRELERI